MNKILFLDFDGVITTEKSRYNLDKRCCDRIQKDSRYYWLQDCNIL